ncbi:MAG TPA: AsmA-like C-terminal region-containing protein, partial [Gemmatimonadales bacterium]
AGIPYLRKVRLDLSTDVAADLAKKSFTLKESGVRLNELTLAFSGSVASVGERLALDIAFGAPKTEFKHILSLVPAVYTRDFASVQTSGSLAVSGKVKGEYGEDAFPSLTLNARVENGTFRYPDLPLPARDIALDLAITNPGGDADSTTVNLRRFHVVLGQNPVDAVLVVRTPISDPDVDARVAGKVDLSDLRRTMKLEGMQELAGTIAADAAVRTRMSWLDSANPQYDRISARGTVNVAGVTVKSDSLPHPLSIREASLTLAPKSAELRSFDATIGGSDMRLSGRLDNLLGFALRDDVLRGSATLASRRFDLNEWRSDEGELSVIPVPANLDFGFDATVNEVLYDNLTLRNARGRLRVKDQRITLENFTFNTLGGGFAINGFYETTDVSKPTFDVGVKIQKLDIPQAFEAFTTVKMLAPVAEYAKGTFSTDLKLSGPLGKDMMPVYTQLTGQGSLQTSILRLQDFPPLDKVASLTKLSLLQDPGLKAVSSKFAVRDGRLHVQPFDVGIGQTSMRVSGSNGIDKSLDYDLSLKVPRSLLGAEANQAISGLMSKAAGAGVDLGAAQEIALGIKLGGKVNDPSVSTNVGSVAGSTAQAAGQAVQEAAEQQVNKAVDSAKQRASAEAAKLVAEAEKQAASIRAEGNALAEKVKKEGYLQADSLVAKSKGPLEQAAAKLAADRLRKETDTKAAGIVKEADTRANSLVAEAKKKAAP